MDSIFIFLAFIIYGLVKLFEWLDRNGNRQREKRYSTCRHDNDDDNRYLDRIFILDAAANGVFVPGAERVFDDPEGEDARCYEEYEDESNYYSSYDDNAY